MLGVVYFKSSVLNCFRFQRRWVIKVLLPQLHDIQAGINICKLDHWRIVEKEVQRGDRRVNNFEPLAMDAKDIYREPSGPRRLIRWEEDRLIRVGRCDVVSLARLREDTL